MTTTRPGVPRGPRRRAARVNAPASGASARTDGCVHRRLEQLARGEGPDVLLRFVDADDTLRAAGPRDVAWRAIAVAGHLQATVPPADGGHPRPPRPRVACVLPADDTPVYVFLGAMAAGCVPSLWAPPSPRMRRDDMDVQFDALLRAARPDAIVTTAALREVLPGARDAPDRTRLVVLPEEVLRGSAPSDQDVPAQLAQVRDRACAPAPVPTDAPLFVQYSSGTTGIRKGVAISDAMLARQVEAYGGAVAMGCDDRVLSWLPLYHDMGLVACFLAPLLRGASIVLQSPFDWITRPASWIDLAARHRATLSWLPNFAFDVIARSAASWTPDPALGRPAEEALATLRGIVSCAEPIHAASWDRFRAALAPMGLREDALATSYALAEHVFAATSGGFGEPPRRDCVDADRLARDGLAIPVERDDPRARTCIASGRALPGVRVRIRTASGDPCAERAVGEIELDGPCLFHGYDGSPALTQRVLRDGAFRTGDRGYLADGHLFVLGRLDDGLLIRGRTLDPEGIESCLNDLPGLVAGRVAVVAEPDPGLGTDRLLVVAEVSDALACPRPGDPSGPATTPERATSSADRRSLVESVIDRVRSCAEGCVPRVVLVPRGTLSKSSSGKLSRSRIRAEFAQDAAESASPGMIGGVPAIRSAGVPASGPGVAAEVHRIFRERAAASSDSLGRLALLLDLERTFRVTITPQVLGRVRLARGDDPLRTADGAAALMHAALCGASPARGGHAPGATVRLTPGRCGRPGGAPFDDARSRRWTRRLRKLGVRVGRGLRVRGPLLLRLESDPARIEIGDDVTLMPWVDLKIREQGRIVLHDGAVLDTIVRLVAARDGSIIVGERAQLGMGTIVNAGERVAFGTGAVTAGHCTILASEHRWSGPGPILEQGYDHAPVEIGDGAWIAAGATVMPGSRVGDGAVIGAGAVVRGTIPACSLAAGNPARVIGFRG
ncbi:MAG: AMP-binding protein [Phycisphaeraceae bacterium]|nr:AMP-binding protein [Phycisphaeraceae bacterium]